MLNLVKTILDYPVDVLASSSLTRDIVSTVRSNPLARSILTAALMTKSFNFGKDLTTDDKCYFNITGRKTTAQQVKEKFSDLKSYVSDKFSSFYNPQNNASLKPEEIINPTPQNSTIITEDLSKVSQPITPIPTKIEPTIGNVNQQIQQPFTPLNSKLPNIKVSNTQPNPFKPARSFAVKDFYTSGPEITSYNFAKSIQGQTPLLQRKRIRTEIPEIPARSNYFSPYIRPIIDTLGAGLLFLTPRLYSRKYKF
jgi:hypothetical protein